MSRNKSFNGGKAGRIKPGRHSDSNHKSKNKRHSKRKKANRVADKYKKRISEIRKEHGGKAKIAHKGGTTYIYTKQHDDSEIATKGKERVKSHPQEIKHRLDSPDKYPPIEFCQSSGLKKSLLDKPPIVDLMDDFTASNREQLYDGVRGETDLVMGIDFGTSNTKVVIMEPGSRRAYAIPFARNTDNPYLIPSRVAKLNGNYVIKGDVSELIAGMKGHVKLSV